MDTSQAVTHTVFRYTAAQTESLEYPLTPENGKERHAHYRSESCHEATKHYISYLLVVCRMEQGYHQMRIMPFANARSKQIREKVAWVLMLLSPSSGLQFRANYDKQHYVLAAFVRQPTL